MLQSQIRRRHEIAGAAFCLSVMLAGSVRADEVWIAPTYQQDVGGLGVASNTTWPVTPIGAVRFAWSVPNDLQTFQSAKVSLIPAAPAGAATLTFFVCAAENTDLVTADCAGPFTQPFTGVANHIVEVDMSAAIGAHLGTPGATYLNVLAFTTPTTTTDHFVGLRFDFTPTLPAGVATLGANTFTGTQTAPSFVGSGIGLTGVAKLTANTFTGTQAAPSFVGSGIGLTGVAKLTANTFTATQTITTGNLVLDASSPTTGVVVKAGVPFIHDVGSNSTFVGQNSANLTNTGFSNVGVGFNTLNALTSGGGNTAIGATALQRNTSGLDNTAIGDLTLVFNTTGGLNTAVGNQAMVDNATGNANTAIGNGALEQNTGSSNTALGAFAGSNASTGSNNIYVGAGVNGVAGESNAMYLGLQGTQTKTILAGVRGITTGVGNAVPVLIDSNGQLGTASSSVRFKEDIRDMADASRRLFDLRPVSFRYSQAYADGSKPTQFGLIAEEVAAVFPELAVRDADGRIETVHYETLNVLLLNELQRQEKRIQELEQKLDDLLGRH